MARKDLQPTIAAPSRQVVARPVDTMVDPGRPAGPPVGPTGAEQLARALAPWNDALNTMARQYESQYKEEAEAFALKKINGLTLDEANKAVQDGAIRAEHSPWAQAAFEKLYGRKRAAERIRATKEAITRGDIDPDNADVSQIFRQYQAEDSNGINSRFFHSGYNAVLQDGEAQIDAVFREIKTERFLKERDATILESMRADVEAFRSQGLDNEKIAGALFEYGKTNKAFFNIPKRETDKFYLALARKLADEGEEDLVSKLLEGKRPGNTPSLADNPQHALAVAQYKTLAEKKAFEKREESYQDFRVQARVAASEGKLTRATLVEAAVNGAFKDSEIEDLRVQNEKAKIAAANANTSAWMDFQKDKAHKAHMEAFITSLTFGRSAMEKERTTRIPKPKGGFTDVSTAWNQETKDDAYTTLFANDPTYRDAPNEPLRLRRQIQIIGANGDTYTPWKNQLAAGATSAATLLQAKEDMLLKGGEVPPALIEGVKLFNVMEGTNPALLARHLGGDKEAERFYSSVNVLMDVRGLDPDAAIKEAVSITRQAGLTTFSGGRRFAVIEEKVGDYNPWFGSAPRNGGEIMRLIRDTAMTYPHLTPDEAIEAANAEVQRAYTNVNGWMVNTQGRDQDFVGALPEISKKEVARYIETEGKAQGIEDPDELVMAPVLGHDGVWMIRDMSRGGTPLVDGSGKLYLLRKSELRFQHAVRIEAKAMEEQAKSRDQINKGIEENETSKARRRKMSNRMTIEEFRKHNSPAKP